MGLRQVTAQEHDNVQMVQRIYAAFGRGDIPAILQALAPDVEWMMSGSAEIAFAGARQGREQVVECFTAIAQTVDVLHFEPQEFIAQGDTVVVLGVEQLRVKATGKVAENPWVMAFAFRNGQVVRFREFDDTGALAAAFRPGLKVT